MIPQKGSNNETNYKQNLRLIYIKICISMVEIIILYFIDEHKVS
jgi:hypothetical protein